MKQKTMLLCCILFLNLCGFAQNTKKTDTLKVYGNCGMCKSTIEGSLKKKDGVVSKKWDNETQILTVTYRTSKTSLEQIAKKVADVGYDNRFFTAPDEKYNSLHSCCQYERPKTQQK